MNKKLCIYGGLAALLLSSCTTLPVSENYAKQPKPVKEFVESDVLQNGSISFKAVDLHTGKKLADYRGKNALVPASVMKIITSAAAYEILGADATIETKLLYEGKISKGELRGDLFIQGGGDPSLGSDGLKGDPEEFLKNWITEMKIAGIKSVKGDIVVLDDLFGYDGIPGKWSWEDLGTDYSQGIYGISVFDNLYTLYMKSSETEAEVVGINPWIKELTFENKVKISPDGKRDLYVRGIPFDNNRIIGGIVPKNQEIIKIKSDIPDPGMFLGEYFKEYMLKNGIKFSGKVTTARISEKKPLNPVTLAVTESAPLSKMINILLTRSDNHYAEHIYQLLKLKGIDVAEFWKEKGMNTGSLTMYDGSGLGRGDTLAAELLTDVLAYMYKTNPEYENLFPVAGKDGTVAGFLDGTPLDGNARIKTGSMGGVQSYAGYLTKDDKKVAFAIIVNHWNGERQELRDEIEKLLNGLVK